MTKDIVLNALLMAVWRRHPQKQVLVQSDQGSQFAESFFQLLKRERIKKIASVDLSYIVMEDNFSIYINNKLMITKNKKANKGCRRKVIIDLNQMLLLFNNYNR